MKIVIYKALNGEYGTWVRPLSMWDNPIEVDDNTVKQFEYIGENNETDNLQDLSEALRAIESTLSKNEIVKDAR